MYEEDRSDMVALMRAGVGVSWDGRRVVAPPGVVSKEGYMDLSKWKQAPVYGCRLPPDAVAPRPERLQVGQLSQLRQLRRVAGVAATTSSCPAPSSS
jgi:hypothetical protein